MRSIGIHTTQRARANKSFGAMHALLSLALALALSACGSSVNAAAGENDSNDGPKEQLVVEESISDATSDGAAEAHSVTEIDVHGLEPDAEDPEQDEDSDTSEGPSLQDVLDASEPTHDYASLAAQIEEVLAPYGDAVSVVFAPLEDQTGGVRLRDTNTMRSASMIKLPILATLLEQDYNGVLSLGETHVISYDEIVGGTGSLQYQGAGGVYTLDQLAWHMIAESDNTATNVLIDRLGFSAVNAYAAEHALTQTSLGRKMMDYDAMARGEDNYTSASDIAQLLLQAADGKLVSPEASERAIGYLRDQTDAAGIAQGLPQGITFAHKTGVLDDVRHDGGIVYAERPYVLVVMAQLPQGTADYVSATISQICWDWWAQECAA